MPTRYCSLGAYTILFLRRERSGFKNLFIGRIASRAVTIMVVVALLSQVITTPTSAHSFEKKKYLLVLII